MACPNNGKNNNTRNSTYMGTSSSDNGTKGTTDYTASRTSTDTGATVLGMDSTTWIWLIIAAVTIAVITLIYSYVKQNNTNDYDHSED